MTFEEYRNFLRDEFVTLGADDELSSDKINWLINEFNSFGISSFFKYVGLSNGYTFSNLETDVFHLSDLSRLDDVQECKYYIDESVDQRISIFSSTFCHIKKKVMENIEYIKNHTTVFSLATSYDNSAMWGKYGDSSQGLCIEYDAQSMFDFFAYKLCPVVYSDTVPARKIVQLFMGYKATNDDFLEIIDKPKLIDLYLKEYACNEQIRFFMDIATTKSKDWSFQDEWRVIEIATDRNDISVNNGINKCGIEKLKPKSIILGTCISEANKQKILRIAREKRIPVYCLVSEDSSYRLIKRDIAD